MNIDSKVFEVELLNYPKPCFVNIGTGIGCSIAELAKYIQAIVGFDGNIVFDISKPDGTASKILDVSKMKLMGWEARMPLSEGLRLTYEWYCKRL